MKSILWVLVLCLTLVLSACGQNTPTSAPPAPTSDGQVAPTDAPPTNVEPTSEPQTAPTEAATQPPAGEPTAAPTGTATPGATVPPRPRPSPTSSGPLDFQVYVAGCKRAPTADKPGNVVVTISVEATGGNGTYRYFNNDVEEPDKFVDIAIEQSNRIIGRMVVVSGDQTLNKEYDFPTRDLDCGA